ncbi:MAG: PA2169 family four-helix-bundle protein [Aquabacterium sp.]
MTDDFTLEILNDLIEACKDGEQDFLLCARHTESEELRQRFMVRSTRCRNAAIELQAHVVEYGGRGEVGVSAAGALHRGWLKVRGAVLSRDDRDWIEECSRTEVLLLTRYRSAMQSAILPGGVQITVERQYHAWQHVHHQMRTLYSLIKVPH